MKRCPICGAATRAAVRPFCSKRCADIDLGRWLGGEYRIAVRDGDAEYAEAANDAQDEDPESGEVGRYGGQGV